MADLEPVSVRAPDRRIAPERQIALVDLLDRVLAGGVVLQGDLSIGIADVELVRVSLRAVVASVSALVEQADKADKAAEAAPAARAVQEEK